MLLAAMAPISTAATERGCDAVRVDFDTVADELYSLPPEEFTAARGAREKEAKAAGDGDLAGEVHQLTKPNAVGWLVNQLVRRHPAEIQPLIELGNDLRQATAIGSGDRLRELSRLQRRLISALVEEARQLARDEERTVSADTARGVADTLRAALADEAAARQLMAGRLTGALFRSGLADDTEPKAAPEAAAPETTAHTAAGHPAAAHTAADPGAGERRRLLRRERAGQERANQLAAAATDARQQAQSAVDQAERAVREAAERVESLQAELAAAQAAQAIRERELRGARAELRTAQRVEREAGRRQAEVRSL